MSTVLEGVPSFYLKFHTELIADHIQVTLVGRNVAVSIFCRPSRCLARRSLACSLARSPLGRSPPLARPLARSPLARSLLARSPFARPSLGACWAFARPLARPRSLARSHLVYNQPFQAVSQSRFPAVSQSGKLTEYELVCN